MSTEKPRPGVRLAIVNSTPVPRAPDPSLLDDEQKRGGRGGGEEVKGLPDDSPLIPLGHSEAGSVYYTPTGYVRDRDATKLGLKHILQDIAPRADWLEFHYGRRKKITDPDGNERWITNGYHIDAFVRDFTAACAAKGKWDEVERMRGRGAWQGSDGELVLHCGNAVFIDGKHNVPGIIGRHVYRVENAILHPAPAAAHRGHPGQELLADLKTWSLKRREGDLDATLLCGMIGAGFLAGVLPWRPVGHVIGMWGGGKSTLHKYMSGLHGGGVMQLVDTTAAGIYQAAGISTLPVYLDEFEPLADSRKNDGIIKLVRTAASGGKLSRGVQDNKAGGVLIEVRFATMLFSVDEHAMLPQDRSRIARFELSPLTPGGKAPNIDTQRLRQLGARILRRLVDGYPRLAVTLEVYRAALLDKGHSARSADVHAALLGCADLVLHDTTPDADSVAEFVRLLEPVREAEAREQTPTPERCLQHLRSSAAPLGGGGLARRPVSHWVHLARSPRSEDRIDARVQLRNLGLGMYPARADDATHIAVPVHHAEFEKLYTGTLWASHDGREGTWTAELRKLPGAMPGKINGGVRVTLVPIGLVDAGADFDDAIEADEPSLLNT